MSQIVIVGAGLGGISAAVRLASEGHRVTLVEKNPLPGGKMNVVEAKGFRFDTGPSVVTFPGILANTFQAAGRRMTDYLTLRPLEPVTRYRFANGSSLDMSSNLPRLVSEVGGLSPGDITGLFRFLAYSRMLYERACTLDPHTAAFSQWMEWARGQSSGEAQQVAKTWHAILPGDVDPILYLMHDAAGRNAFPTALKFLARAEQIDSVHPAVRRARLLAIDREETMTIQDLEESLCSITR